MNRVQTYNLISKLLFSGTAPDYMESIINILQSPTLNWNRFIAMGSNHLVLQTIYGKLLQYELTKYIPSEVHEHLKYIHTLNYQRNTGILQQVNSINTLFNRKGIVPLYLKGVGNIIDGLYSNIAERIMHDIDILVPDEQWELAVDILLQDGYLGRKVYNLEKRNETKHYPSLSKPGGIASVEIHRLPLNFKYSDALEINELWQNKKLIAGNNECYVMCDNHKIIHNFIHSQMVHGGNYYAKVSLRNLYDLFLLSRRENLYVILAGMNNYGKQASNYLTIMNKVFGIYKPQEYVLKQKSNWYFIRYEINLHSRFISIGSQFILKIFQRYIKLFFRAFINKELRISLINRLFDKNWYGQHLRSYKHI